MTTGALHAIGLIMATYTQPGDRVLVEDDLDALVDAITAIARSGDQVLVMSNGGFGGIHEKLLGRLQELQGCLPR